MKSKILILIILFFTAFKISNAQDRKSLNKAIFKVLNAYENKDDKTMNAMISKDIGIVFLYRRGAHDNITKRDSFSFENPVPEYLPYEKIGKTATKIKHQKLPEFECSVEKFNLTPGIYCQKTTKERNLSTVAQHENEFLDANWTPEHFKLFNKIEDNGYRIIAYNRNDIDSIFIFHLTWLNNKWYLTVIDRFEVCSA